MQDLAVAFLQSIKNIHLLLKIKPSREHQAFLKTGTVTLYKKIKKGSQKPKKMVALETKEEKVGYKDLKILWSISLENRQCFIEIWL